MIRIIKLKTAKLFLMAIALMMGTGGFAQNKNVMPVDVNIHFIDKANNPNLILYKIDRGLAIKDFQGNADMSSEGVGATYSGIQLSMDGKSQNGRMYLNVSLMLYFDKSQSWMKPEGKNDRVLKHEQIHFDLTAIYACKMYDAIVSGKYNSKDVKQRLHEIHEQITNELQQQQNLYDKETQHGTVPEVQQKWAEKVAKMKSELACL